MARSRGPVTNAAKTEKAGEQRRGDQRRAHITDQVMAQLRHGLMTGAFIRSGDGSLRLLAVSGSNGH